MKLNQDEIKTILPHREPMLLVTSVEDLRPGEDIRAVQILRWISFVATSRKNQYCRAYIP